ncbi:hypothetical protein L345_07009, partial [Ophiophagus hannah]
MATIRTHRCSPSGLYCLCRDFSSGHNQPHQPIKLLGFPNRSRNKFQELSSPTKGHSYHHNSNQDISNHNLCQNCHKRPTHLRLTHKCHFSILRRENSNCNSNSPR